MSTHTHIPYTGSHMRCRVLVGRRDLQMARFVRHGVYLRHAVCATNVKQRWRARKVKGGMQLDAWCAEPRYR
jgi:hypothetical protein